MAGLVQGVGFRPFVHRTATELGVAGWVGNDAAGVVLEAEGDVGALDELCRRLTDRPPPLAHVETVHVEEVLPTGGRGFTIAGSTTDGHVEVPVGADTAPCDACRAELLDPADRRHRYPFLSCTDCGPRYTIVERLPYDRARTTMRAFALCGPCEAEFTDPSDRRFHAQPTACPDCGPQLTWRTPDGAPRVSRDPALVATVATLRDGGLAAVKGVGGYHLLCRADDAVAVARLRLVKARQGKPFAVLVADLAAADDLADLTDADRVVLAGPQRPVVLVPVRPEAALADGIAPGLAEVGLLLPPSPLHELLAHDVGAPLVCTSGNLAGEPIVHRDEDAVARLGPLVDGVLSHDRAIHVRCDDSVVRGGVGGPLLLRRSRGYAPMPLPLPGPHGPPVLAVGGHLKTTVAVAHGCRATISHHVGDLDDLAAREALWQAVDHLCHLTDTTPALVAHDLHPEYASTAIAHELADRWQVPTVAVQHHHAHVVSCLVENRREAAVLGIAFDGLGYGTDGTIWGGELLVADLAAATRVGHLRTVPQPGGDVATREPWRMAVAWIRAALGDAAAVAEGERHDLRAAQVAAVCAAPVTPVTSSVGRLFDAVAALLGLRSTVSYEGEAAMRLEAAAGRAAIDPAPPVRPSTAGGVLDPSPLLAHLVTERDRGTPLDVLAARFHDGFAAAVAALAADLAEEYGLEAVALTGGVFTNRRLTTAIDDALRARGRQVLRHAAVPCNDGGLSLGQLAVARAR